ncbi:hypothetical protein SEA_DARDANUS_40 [Gordonia phage Dardanus]|uniref:BrnT-like toxin n=1 Tax=Gordonia phage Dardanus TaxID=2588489 RepID=A0A514CX32_9CAUD|nr:hypothetical protein KDJ58_gp40 [Gordonia phage Dardanus]QDH85077.1 hypothetical protein SEA_DARDANUS_40 [Gordonia phage Dardanus]
MSAEGVDLETVDFSRHATQRALDMAVGADEIRACIERPAETRRLGYPRGDGTRRWKFTRGRLAVVMQSESNGRWTAVTVLWSREGLFRNDFAMHGEYEGRTRKSRTRAATLIRH